MDCWSFHHFFHSWNWHNCSSKGICLLWLPLCCGVDQVVKSNSLIVIFNGTYQLRLKTNKWVPMNFVWMWNNTTGPARLTFSFQRAVDSKAPLVLGYVHHTCTSTRKQTQCMFSFETFCTIHRKTLEQHIPSNELNEILTKRQIFTYKSNDLSCGNSDFSPPKKDNLFMKHFT